MTTLYDLELRKFYPQTLPISGFWQTLKWEAMDKKWIGICLFVVVIIVPFL